MLKSEIVCVSGKTSNPAPPRTNLLYMPPAKLRVLQASLTDKSTIEYKCLAWQVLKKTITGRLNKVNTSNLPIIIRQLFEDNILRGRGRDLLAQVLIKVQITSPFYTAVYAAFVSSVNTKFPHFGELICKLLISSFRRTYKSNDKNNCLATTKFLAHLINQNVLCVILALEIPFFLLQNPTDDSIELTIEFLKDCGQKLLQVFPRRLDCIFSALKNLLDESSLNKRTQDMIAVLFTVQQDQFTARTAIQFLVYENDQHAHILELHDYYDLETMINVFKYDEHDDGNEEKEETIIDETETNLVTLRRIIYLTIRSSINPEECAHKLLQMKLNPNQEVKLCKIIVDNCTQRLTYEPYFGLLGQHFCLLNKQYIQYFRIRFGYQYILARCLENYKLRNAAKFFAHLLVTDSIPWNVLHFIHLTENSTQSSTSVYVKILFLELFQSLGFTKLKDRLTDPTLIDFVQGIFSRDNPKNTRFCINFFTSIGLGRITDELKYL